MRLVLQALGHQLDRPLIVTGVPADPVTLDFPNPVPISKLLGLLRGLVESRGFELSAQSDYYTITTIALLHGATSSQAPGGRVRPIHAR